MGNSGRFKFDGGAATYWGTAILAWLVAFLTLGICLPFSVVLMMRWGAKHVTIDGHRLKFTGSAWSLFGHWILWWFLMIITFGIYSFWVVPRLVRWVVENTDYDPGYAMAYPTSTSFASATPPSLPQSPAPSWEMPQPQQAIPVAAQMPVPIPSAPEPVALPEPAPILPDPTPEALIAEPTPITPEPVVSQADPPPIVIGPTAFLPDPTPEPITADPTPVATAPAFEPVADAGWFPDPHGRHEFRYWDGASWSNHVSDRGVASTD